MLHSRVQKMDRPPDVSARSGRRCLLRFYVRHSFYGMYYLFTFMAYFWADIYVRLSVMFYNILFVLLLGAPVRAAVERQIFVSN